MSIRDFLAPSDVLVDVRAAGKTQLLQELCDRAAAATGLAARSLLRGVLAREALGSTGIGKGIALPHARLEDVGKPYGIFARLKRPIDFDAIDGQPVDLVFLLLLPASSAHDTPNALTGAARRLRDPACLVRLREADEPARLFAELAASHCRARDFKCGRAEAEWNSYGAFFRFIGCTTLLLWNVPANRKLSPSGFVRRECRTWWADLHRFEAPHKTSDRRALIPSGVKAA